MKKAKNKLRIRKTSFTKPKPVSRVLILGKVVEMADYSFLLEGERSKKRSVHATLYKQVIGMGKAGQKPNAGHVVLWGSRLSPFGNSIRTTTAFASGTGYSYCPAHQIMPALKQWFENIERDASSWWDIAFAHRVFLYIHPLADFNGRVGRLLLAWHCSYVGQPLVCISPRERSEYIECLDTDDIEALAELFQRCRV